MPGVSWTRENYYKEGDEMAKCSLENRVIGWINENFDLDAGKINVTDFPMFPGGKLLYDKENSKHQMVAYWDILNQEIKVVYPQ